MESRKIITEYNYHEITLEKFSDLKDCYVKRFDVINLLVEKNFSDFFVSVTSLFQGNGLICCTKTFGNEKNDREFIIFFSEIIGDGYFHITNVKECTRAEGVKLFSLLTVSSPSSN